MAAMPGRPLIARHFNEFFDVRPAMLTMISVARYGNDAG